MARCKILLALFLFASCLCFSSAADDSAEVGDSLANEWADKECTVVNARAPKYYLYMRGFWLGRFVSYKRFRRPDKSTRWIITPVKRDGNIYFEMKNVDGNTLIAPRRKKYVTGNFDSFTKSHNIETLWKFDPPMQGVPISITSSSMRKFINKPRDSSSSRVALEKRRRTTWRIKCD